jgi:glycosyltransferase involved in cell wall biosynthesis/2-polyprenyl-3-methyl-5-hydroxy-6-metoxy-1,4-benzoquinol methylase
MDGDLRYDRAGISDGEDSLSAIARRVPAGSTVLDLGAATGALGAYLHDHRGCTVDGVESNQQAAALARPHYRALLELNLEIANLADHFAAHSYDIIVCADVLEHLREPGSLLTQLHGLLTASGRLLVSIPNVGYAGIVAGLLAGEFEYRPTGLLDETHLRFFTRQSLLRLLGKHGFGALAIQPLQLEVRHSEFKDGPFEKLPPKTSLALLDAPDALSYQFIVEAAPGPHAPRLLELLRRPLPRFEVQLYWAGAGEGFDERRCVSKTLLLGGEEPSQVELMVPEGQPEVARLRFDVADRPGFLRLEALELRSGAGKIVWKWDGDPRSLPVRHELIAFSGPLGQTWLCTGADPYFELPLPARIPAGCTLVARLDWPASRDYTLATTALRELDSRERARGELLALLQQSVNELRKEQLAAAGRERALEERLAGQSQRLRTAENQVAHLSQRIQRVAERVLSLETAPLVSKALRTARSSFLRQRIPLEAIPGKHVREVPDGWQSLGEDPSFELRPRGRRFPSGWVEAEIELSSDRPWLTPPTLYVDGGDGYGEHGTFALPAPRDGKIKLLLKLPPFVRSMRFDPFDRPGQFKLGKISMQEMGKLEVGVRGLARMSEKALQEPEGRKGLLKKTLGAVRSRGMRGFAEELRDLARGDSSDPYVDWVTAFDTLTSQDREQIAARVETLQPRPLFSVIMPVYDTPERWLRRAIESVQAQLYPDWELCIADDASQAKHIRPLLTRLAAEDPRIKITLRERNGHISAASNSALELATGSFVVLLDHDDELAPHALYMLAEELAAHPETDLLYSDEDKIDEKGRRFDPYFKNDWSPDLLSSQNYFSHLGAYRTSLVREAGGFRQGYEGSQDYDLALRCAERTNRVRHVPAVLYHWRAIAGSTAIDVGEKSYAQSAAERALRDYLLTVEPGAKVEPGAFPTIYRVSHPLPEPPPLASILIPTRDGMEVVRRAVQSIREKTTYPHYEIVIVDNDSRDPATLSWLREVEGAGGARVLRYPHPFNYSSINNFAAREARGEVLVLLNNDVEVISPGWLTELVSQAVRPGVGAVGARLLYPNGTVQHAGVVTGIYGVAGHIHRGLPRESPGYFGRAQMVHEVSVVTAACLAIKKSIYEQVSGLDEKNLAVAFNDVDFCLRLVAAGYRNLYTPYAELFHYESYSRGSDDSPEKRARFEKEVQFMLTRWKDVLEHDPAYNQNLSLTSESFALAWPPRARKPWKTE